ncbi:MAG: ubiquinone biosynthesis regulatory protein kinase UbiB [Gammaproteobacteria bacterium]|nr:ubiquinone biosynthesis regulatory protein kinase UbiB [Gammaproteobacteria bacterium]
MKAPRQVLRLLHINFVLVKHGLDELILATHLFRPLRYLVYFLPWYWLRGKRAPRGERIRLALEELGPIFVKFGQLLSTRPDLLPEDIAAELALLQDRVTPFPGEQAQRIVEQAYGKPVAQVFQEFDPTPLAAASIAQVHTARLFDGKQVIIKVLRPGVEKDIRRDLDLLYFIAGLAQRYWVEAKRLRPREVVAEFDKTLHDELDLLREAGNASQLRRNFAGSDLLYVPEIIWPLTHRNVMVMERIFATPISNVDALIAQGVNLKTLSERGVEIFFTQVFRHNFFHADMHPGNIFVARDGRYMAVDFGIMGTLDERDQRYLAENFMAFFNRDYKRVAQAHVEAGWVPHGTRVDEFESAIRSVCEPIFERPLSEISFGQLLLRLFQTARRFNMEVQPQLVLLQKTLLSIEGLGRELYPNLDLWTTAKPFLERWMSEQVGWRAMFKALRANAPLVAEKLPHLPLLLHEFLQQSRDGKLQAEWKSPELEKLRCEMKRAAQRNYYAIAGAALLVSAAIITGASVFDSPAYWNIPLPSWILAGLGTAIFIRLWPNGRD